MVNQPLAAENSKFILTVIVIIFSWMVLGNALSYLVKKGDLNHIRARVIDVRKKQYECRGNGLYTLDLCEKLQIKVKGYRRYYTIAEYADPDIGVYVLDVNKGDTVDVYTRKWYQYVLTFGRFNQIESLEKNGETYYTTRRYPIYWIFFGLFDLVIFIPLLYIEMNTERWIAEGKLQ